MQATDGAGPIPLSVVVITLNEERRLRACLKSLPQGAEVVVLDSGSTDGTARIAAECGARVEARTFTNHAEQKNHALSLATRPWVFSLDADEVLDEGLRRSLVEAVGRQGGPSAFRVRRRLVFLGRRMRFGKTADRPVRLFRKGSGRFESDIHERFVLADGGPMGCLEGELEHFSYEDLSDYFARFNSYTSLIAKNHRRNGRRRPLVAALALRPWGEFVGRYFLRLGFLDGYAGYVYALLSSFYTFVKYAKLRELCDGADGGTGAGA
jgi:glycosyltransferase involved in cell wall biosynthesis